MNCIGMHRKGVSEAYGELSPVNHSPWLWTMKLAWSRVHGCNHLLQDLAEIVCTWYTIARVQRGFNSALGAHPYRFGTEEDRTVSAAIRASQLVVDNES